MEDALKFRLLLSCQTSHFGKVDRQFCENLSTIADESLAEEIDIKYWRYRCIEVISRGAIGFRSSVSKNSNVAT